MLKKLRNKILLFNTGLISIIILGSFFFIYLLNASNIEKEIQQLLSLDSSSLDMAQLTSEAILHTLENPNHPIVVNIINSTSEVKEIYIKEDENNVSTNIIDDVSIVDHQIREYHDSTGNDLYQHLVNNIYKNNIIPKEIKSKKRYWRYSVFLVSSENGNLTESDQFIYNNEPYFQFLFLDITDYKKSLSNLRFALFFSSISTIFCIYITSYYLANRAIEPVELAWRKQKEFVSNASHELKTPLAIIQINSEVLSENKKETIESQKRWIENIQLGSERINELVNNLLILTKFEDANQELIKSSIDISSTIQSVHQSMEARASAKKITYKKNIVKNIILESNEQVVSQLTMILIDNAIKYTPENETVFVSLSERNRRVVLRVVNSGNPISQEKIPYLFDRFYRGDSSRNSENSGYGLGLAIAKAITETINAEIIVNVSPDGINHFEVHF